MLSQHKFPSRTKRPRRARAARGEARRAPRGRAGVRPHPRRARQAQRRARRAGGGAGRARASARREGSRRRAGARRARGPDPPPRAGRPQARGESRRPSAPASAPSRSAACAAAGRRKSLYTEPLRGALAQLGERRVCNAEVAGSIPARSTAVGTGGAVPHPTCECYLIALEPRNAGSYLPALSPLFSVPCTADVLMANVRIACAIASVISSSAMRSTCRRSSQAWW